MMMYISALEYSSIESILKLIGLLVLCFLIILASYYVTKFVGSRSAGINSSGFMKPLEVCRIAPNKYLQLVKIGEKYYVLGVSKESVNVVAEVDPSEIPEKAAPQAAKSFKEILAAVKKGGSSQTKEIDDKTH